MSLAPGSRLGAYEILSFIDQGGMGQVYRASDTRLKRDVAIKVLPESFAADPERLARFQREAEVLASLNHPNIAHVYGLEQADGVQALVMELVEGPTLAERIAQGAIPVDDALPIARQIAEALEAAHEQGIIHRDLKPANIKVRPDGTVKVLDFGLAKLAESSSSSTSNASLSPTITSPAMMTGVGVLLGTAAYMSPEQAKGREADKRSDVWAFGCVLYEMLSGRQAFQGEDVSEVLASVLKAEPDFSLLPAKLNPRIREVLRRCLQKNPKLRWHAIGDTRVEIEVAMTDPHGMAVAEFPATVVQPPPWRRAGPVLVAIILTAVLAGLAAWNLKPSLPLAVTRLPLVLGEGERFTGVRFGTQLSISADGTQIVYEANHQLYHRSLSELEARPIPGTQTTLQVLNPVFSPDGRSIAYFSVASGPGISEADIGLKKIAVTGGVPMTICRCPATSVSWSDDGIFLGGTKGIMRISQDGGNPETILPIKSREVAVGPQMLPGGQAVLFTLVKEQFFAGDPDDAQIVVQSLRSGAPQTLIDRASDARYVPTGHIVYASGGTLFAVAFDARGLKLTGGPVPVVEGIRRSVGVGVAVQYSFSKSGTLIYIPGPVSTTAEQLVLALMDRQGTVEPLKVPARPYAFPRISPDGKRVAFEIDDGKQSNIWIYELSGTQAPRQLTVGGANHYPVWLADGARIAFQSDREGDRGIFWQRTDGGTAERLTKPEQGVVHIPDSWSKDSDSLSFTEVKGAEAAVWILSLKDKKPTVLARAPSTFIARSAFSPDGRWVAYQSGEAGRLRLWVQPFPSTGEKIPIVDGGQPFWSPDGSELFYNAGAGGLISKVNIRTRPNIAFSDPIPVAQGEIVNASAARFVRNADITPDGKLLGLVPAETTQSGSLVSPKIQVVLNWFEELKRRVPTK